MKDTRGMMKPLATATLVLLFAVAAGCAGKNGSIRWDTDAGSSFAAAQVLPGHLYYTTGSDTEPAAIVALREGRPMRADFWREVAMTPEILRKLVDRMRGTRADYPYSRVILDDRGARIGVWYSYLKASTVKLLDDGGVVVAPPLGGSQDGLRPPSSGR